MVVERSRRLDRDGKAAAAQALRVGAPVVIRHEEVGKRLPEPCAMVVLDGELIGVAAHDGDAALRHAGRDQIGPCRARMFTGVEEGGDGAGSGRGRGCDVGHGCLPLARGRNDRCRPSVPLRRSAPRPRLRDERPPRRAHGSRASGCGPGRPLRSRCRDAPRPRASLLRARATRGRRRVPAHRPPGPRAGAARPRRRVSAGRARWWRRVVR